ncbi:MAG: D-alanyl-D-alanine carboxypeptidase [Lachnospiraceae bacterium]|nr:D-alanyl-D-alanine carboxypeptidase [Lachnospiraceae bacterium]
MGYSFEAAFRKDGSLGGFPHFIRLRAVLLIAILAFAATGCGGTDYDMPFQVDRRESAFRFETSDTGNTAETFASKLAVVSSDVIIGEEIPAGEKSYASAVLMDIDHAAPLYARNAFATLYPASMTKVLTAIVALKNAQMDQVLTADSDCVLTEADVQKVGLKPGDTMTMDQALHILLIYSANDVAILIAKNLGGSVEGFAELMNEEAKRIGATNSHFVNPHGLHDENHYTTAYDMYLLFNEAVKDERFNQIIAMNTYSATYQDASGALVDFSCENTNRFLKGDIYPPSNITVVGGKTGTTLAAGRCLVMLSKDEKGNSYVSCVMKSDSIDVMYGKTNSLLGLIGGT